MARSREGKVFRAYVGRKVMVEANSLRDLAERLRDADIDPRSVEVGSSFRLGRLFT